MENIFDPIVAQELISRIDNLNASKTPNWGKMSVDQMLAHCNVTYDMAFTDKYPKPGAIKKFFLKAFVKNMVVNEKPYTQNSRTAPEFIITDKRQFEKEKESLISNIKKTVELGQNHFDGRESHSFGTLTSQEWNNMFYKHLDHHLNQFAV